MSWPKASLPFPFLKVPERRGRKGEANPTRLRLRLQPYNYLRRADVLEEPLQSGTDLFIPVATAQKRLRELKARISAQSKKNFVLERDVRYLDSRIALLIQNVSKSENVF